VASYLCFHGWMLWKGGCSSQPELAEHANAWQQYSSETNYIDSSPSVGNFLDMFYTHKHSNCAVTHLLFYTYAWEVVSAPLAGLEMRTTQIFQLFFPYLFFHCLPTFWFRGFLFESGLNQACESRWCLRAVACHEIWYWAARFETFTERNWAYDGCAWKVSGPRVVLLSPCFRGGVGRVKHCWSRCSSISAFETSS
jgi:hypothetical protein